MSILKKLFGGSLPKPARIADTRPAFTPSMAELILKRKRDGLTKEEQQELDRIVEELND